MLCMVVIGVVLWLVGLCMLKLSDWMVVMSCVVCLGIFCGLCIWLCDR